MIRNGSSNSDDLNLIYSIILSSTYDKNFDTHSRILDLVQGVSLHVAASPASR